MKVTPKELRRMILNEHKRIKLEKSLRLAVRDEVRGILSEQKGRARGKVVSGAREVFGINMRRLKKSDINTYNEMVGLMDSSPDYDADQKWGPVALYNTAAMNARGKLDPDVMEQFPIDDAPVTAGLLTPDNVEAAMKMRKDKEGIVTTSDPDEEWEYKVTDDVWYTRKKDKSTDWIKLDGKKFCQAVKKLDDLFPDMRSASAKSATKKLCAPAKKGAEAAVEEPKPRPDHGPPSPHAIGDKVELDGITWKKIKAEAWQTSLKSDDGTNPYLWVTSPDYKRGRGEGTLIAVKSVQVHRDRWGYTKTGNERMWRNYEKVKLGGGRAAEGPKISKGEGVPDGRGMGPLEGEHKNMPTWADLEGAKVISEASHRWQKLAGILKG